MLHAKCNAITILLFFGHLVLAGKLAQGIHLNAVNDDPFGRERSVSVKPYGRTTSENLCLIREAQAMRMIYSAASGSSFTHYNNDR
jgi:hypothetical protein